MTCMFLLIIGQVELTFDMGKQIKGDVYLCSRLAATPCC